MLYYLLTTLYVLVCLVLLLVILLQQGKGGDMASAFGGGSSQAAFGARGGATVLSKATAVFAVLFMLGALALAIIGQRGDAASVVSGTPAGACRRQRAGSAGRAAGIDDRAPAPAPATPTPATTPAPPVSRRAPERQNAERRSAEVSSQYVRSPSRKWRNWQTHQLEGLAVARPWGFESPLPHQLKSTTYRQSAPYHAL